MEVIIPTCKIHEVEDEALYCGPKEGGSAHSIP